MDCLSILLIFIHSTNIKNAKVCEYGWLFVTFSRKNCLRDFNETLQYIR